MRLTQTSRVALSILALPLMIVSSLVLAHTAHATTWAGPMKQDNSGVIYFNNSTPYGDSFPNGSRQMEYMVSHDGFTDIDQTDILVYMPTQFGTIQIVNKDLCTTTTVAVANSDAHYPTNMPGGTIASEYRLLRPDGVSIAFGTGVWNYNANAATCATATLNLTASAPLASAVQPDPDSGMYVYRVRVNARASGGLFANGFRILAPVGSYISQDSAGAASSFGLQPSYPIPGQNPQVANPPDPYKVYTDIDIPFGPDCSLRSGQNATKTFEIYDADNQGNLDVQPRPFGVQLLKHNRATGAYTGSVPLALVSGAATQTGPDVWDPQGPNKSTTVFSFNANGDEIYKLRIYRLYYDNTLQFKIPYDNIWFFKTCANAVQSTVQPVVTMAPATAEAGETLTGTAKIIHTENLGGTGRVNYGRLIWSDTNRNNVYDTGEQVFGGTPDSGTVNVPPGGYDFPTWSEVADTGIHGGRICIYLSITGGGSTTVAGSPTTSCADIGKKPKLQVADGDVMVGGTFRNASGVCPTQVASNTSLQLRGSTSTIAGVTYGSYADYGAISLGEIVEFGANGSPPSGFANYTIFGNNPSPLGYFYSNSSPSRSNPTRARCLNDPFAAFGSKAVTNTALTNIDAATAGNVSVTATGTVTIGASSPLPAGYHAVIYAKNATEVVISGNITYAEGPYASVNDIPQLVILSEGKITVRANATRLDGIYGTKSDFQTCDVVPTINTCNQRLEVNGAVIVGGQVIPYRTAGAQKPNYADKAEIFRLRPDVLLNQVPGPGTPTNIRTINQREVPPRF